MKKILSLLLAGLLALSLAGCAEPEREKRTRTVFAMDTVMELTVYGPESVLDETEKRLRELESTISVTDPDSQISALNRGGGTGLSGDAAALYQRALELCRLTGGALDITVYPLVRAWGFTTGQYRVPDEEEIGKLLKTVGYEKISGYELPEGSMIDLGAVAKGYAADALARLWRDAGIKSGLMNLGGNVYAIGRKPDGTKWRIGVRDPFSDTVLGALEVEDTALVTSGGYERYFEAEGVRYHHIIDPGTGAPARSGLASVTVVGNDGTVCDGLSTGLFVMGLEKAAQFWREYGLGAFSSGFEAVFVTDGGEIYITEGLEGSFLPMNGYQNAEIKVIRRG